MTALQPAIWNHLHDFALAAVSSNRQTAADYLAEAGDIGVDVIEGLAAALSAAEAAQLRLKKAPPTALRQLLKPNWQN